MAMPVEKYVSPLDTARFGFKIAKIDHYEDSPAALLKALKEFGVQLVLSRISFEHLELINQLENYGFVIKDSQVTYSFDLKKQTIPNLETNNDLIIREFEGDDLEAVVSLLGESFEGYGHYFADSRLDVQKCREIYKDWGRRSCLDPKTADIVYVASYHDEIAGMLSFKKYAVNGEVYAAGGLGAVSSKFRSRKVFRQLAIQGLRWGKENRLDREEHNVLINNYPVNRSFTSLGFKIVNAYVTLHGWL